jgi:hypothetical protein
MAWRQRVNQPDSFVPYVPNARICLVIGPGAGWVQNKEVYDTIRKNGYTVIGTWDDAYDAYPASWACGRSGYNLESFVDDIMVPTIKKLVNTGNGPSFLICGSRGGQVCLNRLWKTALQCPTLCINAGLLMTSTRIPKSMRLVLATFGGDEFPTSDCDYTNVQFGRLASSTGQRAILYHHKHDGHMPIHLASDIMALVHVITTGTDILEDIVVSRWARLSMLVSWI